jgi:hypothetical protein
MAQLYLYQAVDIVTQKVKSYYIFCREEIKNDANGVKTFTKYTNVNVVALKETITSN